MTPAISNYCVAMFWETPLIFLSITVLELTRRVRSVAGLCYHYLEPMAPVCTLFPLMSIRTIIGLRYLKCRFGARL